MKGFQKPNPYRWSLIDKNKYVFWEEGSKAFKPFDYETDKNYTSLPGVRSAEEHLRKMNGMSLPKKPLLGYGLFFFIDESQYGLPMRILEKFMLQSYGTGRYVARWEEFDIDALKLLRGHPKILLNLRTKYFPESTPLDINEL